MPPIKPTAVRHLAKAKSNYGLYKRLQDEDTHADWQVTLLFYTALHLVQARIVESAATGFDVPREHSDRDSAVARLLPEIYSHYRFLSTRSQWARYHLDRPVPTSQQVLDYANNRFRPIVTALHSLGIEL